MRFSRVVCLALLAILVPAPSPALAQEIRISHQWAENTDARDRAARVFAQEAQTRSRGLTFRTVEAAAAITDTFYESAQRDVERRMVATLRDAGVTVRRMTKDDYTGWLQLAQRTAWLEYTRINPRAQEQLVTLVRTILEGVEESK